MIRPVPPAARQRVRLAFRLPIRTEQELRAFVWAVWGRRIPNVAVCLGHVSPWFAFAWAFFARSRVSVWKASRGFGGKSTLLATLGQTEAVTLNADVTILGGSGEQSERVHNAQVQAWDRAPRAIRDRLRTDPTQRRTRLKAGNSIIALTASTRSARGPHPQRLRLDEVDEMGLRIFDAVLGQPMMRRGVPAQTVCSSTHHYSDKTMTEVLKRAADKGWPVHQWCYRETSAPHGWLLPEEVEAKRSEVTPAMWDTEYELQDPNPEGRAIDGEAVKRMFRRELGNYRGYPGEVVRLEEPVPHARYATGADWAKKHDWTAIITFRLDVKPWRLVAFERVHHEPWPQMIARLERRLTSYRGSASHDATGLGNVIEDHLKTQVPVEHLQFVGRERTDTLSEYIAAVERGDLEAPYIETMELEHKFADQEAIWGHGHPPDTIVAAALAFRAASKLRHLGLPITVERPSYWRES